MRPVIIFLLCCCSLGAWADDVSWCLEKQSSYDSHLLAKLKWVMDAVPSFPPDAEALISEVGTFYGPFKLGDQIGKSGGSRIAEPYNYFIESVSKNGIHIKAVNRYGGRNYIYDSEWNVVSYVFSQSEEAHRVGQTILDWLTTDKYPERIPEGSVSKGILTALGYRGCYTGLLDLESAKFDVLGTLGVFMTDERFRLGIWQYLLEGSAGWEPVEREKCVRGILSNYETYSPELKKEVLKHVSEYLASVDDEKAKYSKRIADFVLEKGGDVPDRKYWIYDTSWIPFTGATNVRKEGKSKYKAGTVPDEPTLMGAEK